MLKVKGSNMVLHKHKRENCYETAEEPYIQRSYGTFGKHFVFCDGSEYIYPENELSDLYEKYLSYFNPNGGIMLQDLYI